MSRLKHEIENLQNGFSVGVDVGDGVSAIITASEHDGMRVVEIEPQTSTQLFVIKGRLPSRNDAEYAARSHYSVGAKYKKEFTQLVYFEALAQRIKSINGKAQITVTFLERDEKRDADNIIGGGLKYILDGMVAAKVIANDTRRYVDLYINPIKTDRNNPRIEISITGVIKDGKKQG